MRINWIVVATIVGPLLAAVLAVALDRWLERRPKLITWIGHTSAVQYQTQSGPQQINTHSVVLRNAGRRTAHNLRLGHYILPAFSVFPIVPHTQATLPGGGAEVVFPTLVPNEQLTINYLYTPPLLYNQINSYAKSDEGFARVLTVLPTPMQPMWLLRTIAAVFFVGLIAVLYLLTLFGTWVARAI